MYSSWRLFAQKLSDVIFSNLPSTVGLQLLNLWLLKAVLRCINDVTTIKHGHETTGNTYMIWSDQSSFTLLTTPGVYIWRTPKVVYNPECLVPTVKHGGGSKMVWAAISWYSVGPIITLHGRITATEYVDRLDNQVHPMIQTFISENWCSFPRRQCPHSHG
jgi:hypothetical protein